jgi:hypothetical protein
MPGSLVTASRPNSVGKWADKRGGGEWPSYRVPTVHRIQQPSKLWVRMRNVALVQ